MKVFDSLKIHWPEQQESPASNWAISAFLFLTVLLVYANSFPGAFILDDLHIVKANPLVERIDLIKTFRSDYWNYAEQSGLYRPLTILSLALNKKIFGVGVAGFHLVNVVLHAAVCLLLWRLLILWGMTPVASVISAILFAIHPIHAEVVNVVVGRSELLVALFLLSAFVMACRKGIMAEILVCGFYLLALLSKEHAVAFGLLLFLRELFVTRSLRFLVQRWPLYGGLALVTLLWLLWRQGGGVINPLPQTSPNVENAPLALVDMTTRVLTALQLQGLYLWKQFVPVNLQAHYATSDLPAFITEWFSLAGLAVSAGLFAILLGVLYGWRRGQILALLGVLYAVAFMPVSNIFVPLDLIIAERLAYFPSLWFCAGIGWMAAYGLSFRAIYGFVAGIVVIYLLGMGFLSLRQNRIYSSGISLWHAEVTENPSDVFARIALAESYVLENQFENAEQTFREAIDMAPDYRKGLRARTNFLILTDRYEEALATAEKSLSLAINRGDRLGQAQDALDLAEIWLALGNPQRALEFLDPKTNLFSDRQDFLTLRGKSLSALGRDTEAVEAFSRVDMINWGYVIGHLYGQSLYRLGRLTEARQQLENAAMNYGDGSVWNLLGIVRARQGDMPGAIVAFRKAIELEPENTYFRDNLKRLRQGAKDN